MKSQRDVRIVAWLFIISGALALLGAYQGGRFVLGTGLLGVPIGIGLLNYRSGWRTIALVWLWFGLIGFPVLGSLALFAGSNGELFGSRSPLLFAGVFAAAFLLELWQYRVLTRHEVRRWFDLGEVTVV